MVQIVNFTFYVNNLEGDPLEVGAPNVSGDDNLCLFRCLIVYQGADRGRCGREAKNCLMIIVFILILLLTPLLV